MSDINISLDFCKALLLHTRQAVFAYEIASEQLTYLNPAFETVFKKNRLGATAAGILEMVHPDDLPYLKDKYRELLQGTILKDIEFRIELPDATERWLCLTPFLTEEQGQQKIIGYVDDISSVKNLQDYMTKFSDRKNAVLSILSHDLAGPLAMIQNLSGLLAEELNDKNNKDISKLINLIEKTSKQGTRLIQEFIAQEFLESVNTDMVKQRVNIVQTTGTIMTQYEETESLTKKDFRFVASSESIFMEIDENKFMQVINNLISNAIKFTHDDGVITVSIEEQSDAVLFKVADNGIGIPEKYHSTLFDKFTNARRPGVKGEPSIGLGMSIIRTIVAWHNGRIWFESEENKGSTFYISLPKPGKASSADS